MNEQLEKEEIKVLSKRQLYMKQYRESNKDKLKQYYKDKQGSKVKCEMCNNEYTKVYID